MDKYFFLILSLFLLFTGSVQAQSVSTKGIKGDSYIDRAVISTAGASGEFSVSNQTILYSYTIGEAISECLMSSKKILTQGFQQGGGVIEDTLSVKNIENKKLSDLAVKIYPNPTYGQLKVLLSDLGKQTHSNLKYDIRIFGFGGQSLFMLQSNTIGNIVEIDISTFSAGFYFLSIEIREQGLKKIFKISKL